MMSYRDGALFGSVLLLGLGLGFNAEACSTDGWAGGTSNIPANGQAASPPGVSRYSEFCALAITGQAHVQSNFANDTRYRARVYVFDGLTGAGTVEIFEAYSDEAATSPLFKISFNGSQFTFDATDAGGGSTSIASTNGWNVIEFDWDSVGNSFDLWVNADATADAPTGSIAPGVGTVDAVRMGAPNGFGGQTGRIIYDAFESHRTTAVGLLVAGDANNDGNVNSGDIIAIINEFFNSNNLGSGQPDCNEDGNVNSGDIICVINTFFGA